MDELDDLEKILKYFRENIEISIFTLAPLAPLLEVELRAVLMAVMAVSRPFLLASRAFSTMVSLSTSVRLVSDS